MPTTAFIADTIYTPDAVSNGVVVVEDDRIVKAGPRDAVELPAGAREVRLEGQSIAPGFIDIHNHGAGGADVMEATTESLDTVRRVLARARSNCARCRLLFVRLWLCHRMRSVRAAKTLPPSMSTKPSAAESRKVRATCCSEIRPRS